MSSGRFNTNRSWNDFASRFDITNVHEEVKTAAPWLKQPTDLKSVSPFEVFMQNPIGLAAVIRRKLPEHDAHHQLREFFTH